MVDVNFNLFSEMNEAFIKNKTNLLYIYCTVPCLVGTSGLEAECHGQGTEVESI